MTTTHYYLDNAPCLSWDGLLNFLMGIPKGALNESSSWRRGRETEDDVDGPDREDEEVLLVDWDAEEEVDPFGTGAAGPLSSSSESESLLSAPPANIIIINFSEKNYFQGRVNTWKVRYKIHSLIEYAG